MTDTNCGVYERRYIGKGNEWEAVEEAYVLEHLDGPYLDPNIALDDLKATGWIRTPFTEYRYKPAS